MTDKPRPPELVSQFLRYLNTEDTAAFIRGVSTRYTVATLERMTEHDDAVARRAAVLALGFLGDFHSNAVLGKTLRDLDRCVRILAENGIRNLWARAGNTSQRKQLGIIMRLNTGRQYQLALAKACELLDEAPWFAEAWNQRAIALYALERYDESISDCQMTLELNPYHFGAASGLGQCFLYQREPQRALEYFKRALELNPGLEGVRTQIARLERLLKMPHDKQS